MRGLAAVLLVSLSMTACRSPEARRQRGAGPGADVGNRPAQVKMHEGSRPYWKTPVRHKVEGPSLAPAEQARRISLSSASSSASQTGPAGGAGR